MSFILWCFFSILFRPDVDAYHAYHDSVEEQFNHEYQEEYKRQQFQQQLFPKKVTPSEESLLTEVQSHDIALHQTSSNPSAPLPSVTASLPNNNSISSHPNPGNSLPNGQVKNISSLPNTPLPTVPAQSASQRTSSLPTAPPTKSVHLAPFIAHLMQTAEPDVSDAGSEQQGGLEDIYQMLYNHQPPANHQRQAHSEKTTENLPKEGNEKHMSQPAKRPTCDFYSQYGELQNSSHNEGIKIKDILSSISLSGKRLTQYERQSKQVLSSSCPAVQSADSIPIAEKSAAQCKTSPTQRDVEKPNAGKNVIMC